jgi:nitrogenase-stabilizing/protective protein
VSVVKELQKLSAAEEFFQYLAVPFDPQKLSVIRLHVLARFQHYFESAKKDIESLDEQEQKAQLALLLQRAYDDLLATPPAHAKLFKVFQQDFVDLDHLLMPKE